MSKDLSQVACLFPGQGSQYVGMQKVLLEHFPKTKVIFEEAADAIHFNLIKLIAEGPDSELQLTFNAQPAILTTSYAWFQTLKSEMGFNPAAGAGHSLGEYTALLAAGAMTLPEAVKLVRKRGELMQSAVPKGKGKMAAVIGLSDDKVKALCEAASQGQFQVVAANFNAPSQVVIAGHTEAVERAEKLAADPEHPEWKARKVIPLNVSAPFHSPLMNKVALDFEKFLKEIKWQKVNFPVVHNLDAEMRSSQDLVPLLRDQIDHPVLWTSCVQTLENSGMAKFVEVGPSKVLTGLVKRIAEKGTLFSVDSVEEFKKLEGGL